MSRPATAPDAIEQSHVRAREILSASLIDNYAATDRIFAVLMPVQWLAAVVAALWLSPRAWAGTYSTPHIHVWAALLIGGTIAALPTVLAVCMPGRFATRHVVAAGQMLMSALLIHLTGGRIETHFHVFGSLAFLAAYRDWRVLLTATTVVALEHALRGMYFPQSIYGISSGADWRWFEHAGWVIFEDVVLVVGVYRSRREMAAIAAHHARMEATNAVIEATVLRRTQDLAASERQVREHVDSLKSMNSELAVRQRDLEGHQQQLEQLNGALRAATAEAESASSAKSAFLANMSHEIRTPMTAILGFSDLLIECGADPSERLNAAHTIRRNGQHLLTLINDILDLSKIEAGKLDVVAQACDVVQIAVDVIELLNDRARDKCIALQLSLRTPIPVAILTDPLRLKQALVNLAGNAIKFTDRGGVRIEMECNVGAETLSMHVVDSGLGLTPAQVQRLFQPFQQAETATAQKHGGTGLGLVITRSLIRLLGGDVGVISEPGAGSTFSLTIATGPLQGVPLTTRVRPAAPQRELTENPAAEAMHARRILLVEDGPDNQRLLCFILRKAGADVSVASDGEEGVAHAWAAHERGEPFELILMDMQMPVMDGYTATRTLRERGYRGRIAALTAHAMQGEADKCLAAGCDEYLSKPINREALLRAVAQCAPPRAAAEVVRGA